MHLATSRRSSHRGAAAAHSRSSRPSKCRHLDEGQGRIATLSLPTFHLEPRPILSSSVRSSLRRPTKFRDLVEGVSEILSSPLNLETEFVFAIFKFDHASEVIRVFCYKPFSLDTPLIIEIIRNIVK